MNPILILSLIQFLVSEVPVATMEILKIKAMLQQSPDTAAALKSLFDDSNTADDDTIKRVNDWLTANGFQPLPTN